MRAALGDLRPKLVIAFGSADFEDLACVPAVVGEELGDVPLLGGTSGGAVFAPPAVTARAVGITAIAGDAVRVSLATAPATSPHLLEVVPAAEAIARDGDAAAADGFTELACLVIAPGLHVDGEALVAAVRKGSGARALLAGGLSGDELTFDRARVFAHGELRDDRVVVAGLFTRTPIGVAARHGWSAVGPAHVVTRSDGPWLLELDRRPALDVWCEDVRAAGGDPPAAPPSGSPRDLAVYLANRYELGIVDDAHREPIVRAPFDTRADGAVLMSASVAEGTRTRVMHATERALLTAAHDAARAAKDAAHGSIAGALVFACTGRLAALGGAFPEELRAIADALAVPAGSGGGACVFGEIARARREQDAFHNTTVVVACIPV